MDEVRGRNQKKIKSKKEKLAKPKYNLFQNSFFMISLAWKKQKSVIFLCLILAVLFVASNLVGLFIAPTVLGAIQSAVPLNELITLILMFAAALIIVNAAISYFSTNTLFGRIEIRLELVRSIHEKYMITSYPNTENDEVKKKLDKATMSVSSNQQATEAIWNTLTELLKNIIGFCIYLFLLISMNPIVIAIVVITTIAGFFINKYINNWGYRHRDEEAEYSLKMNYVSEKAGDYTAAKDIRIFGMRKWLEDIYKSSYRLYHSFIVRGERVYIWANIVDIILTFLRNGFAYIFLINMVINDGLSASQFLLYFSAIGGFTAWIGGIFTEFSTLRSQSLDISTVREFIEYPEMFSFENGEALQPDTTKQYKLELRNVTFRYPEAEKNTLEKVNLTINPGEKLAIVGLNGAGKTTLVKLLCGFYDPTEGEVLLNGENIKKYNRRDYYNHFSAVFQNFSLLAITIAGNIAQTDENIDMVKVISCAQRAGIAKAIDNFPKKYETNISKKVYEDGTELSGGETQRLMLARVLYKDAPIIILDEPTAALDPIAESDIYNKYNDLAGGRTSIYISHRLASTRFCDRIILIDNNVIAEEGTHDELIKIKGKYANLFEIQSRYYKEDAENEEK